MSNNTATQASFSALPTELLLQIASDVSSIEDLAALTATCRTLNASSTPILNRRVGQTDPSALYMACATGNTGLAAELLATGADPTVQEVISGRGRDFCIDWIPDNETDICKPQAIANAPREFWRRVERLRPKDVIQEEVRPKAVPREVSPIIHAYVPYSPALYQRQRYSPWEPISCFGGSSRDSSDNATPCPKPISNPKAHGTQIEWDKIIENNHSTHKLAWSPIHLAAINGNVSILELLLGHIQHIAGTYTPDLIDSLAPGYGRPNLIYPSIMGRRDRVRQYWRALNPELDPFQEMLWTLHTPLRVAICARQEDAAMLLIRWGAKLDFGPGPHGERDHALHMAARFGCLDVIRHLITIAKVDVDIRDADGWTPLCHAVVSRVHSVEQGGEDALSVLLELGADANATLLDGEGGYDGFTILHLACWDREWDKARRLLDAGAYSGIDIVYQASVFAGRGGELEQDGSRFRAIDMVCKNFGLSATAGSPKTSNRLAQRWRLLAMMIGDYDGVVELFSQFVPRCQH